MRINNRNRTPIYQFMITLSSVLLIVGLGFTFFNLVRLPILRKELSIGLIGLSIISYLIIFIKGRQIFEYDNDGEALNFKNRRIIPFLGKEARDEFPKYKFISYHIINNILFKRLYIKVSSKKKHCSTLKYDISYLNTKEIRDLKNSLDRVIKINQENENK